MKLFCVLCVVCGLAASALAVDREAFTFTQYHLDVRVEPEQQRLAVRGRITLRNDSASGQKNLALQISSSLDWRSIQLAGKAVKFTSHEYTSDIDHTGALSEAIVTLPQEIPAKGTVELTVGYEGIVALDATRLTRLGMPEDKARHSDWDEISKSFTAVRGIGYVTWYPVATEAAILPDGNSVEETVGRWKARETDASMSLTFKSTVDAPIWFSGTPDMFEVQKEPDVAKVAAFSMIRPGISVPMFVIASYQKLAPNDLLTVEYLPRQDEGAKAYAEAAANIETIIPVGRGSESLEILGLPDPEAVPFVSEGMLLSPLKSPVTNEAVLNIVYAKARHLALSPRAWIQDGLAHYAQVAFIEENAGRQAALDYLAAHQTGLVESEKEVKRPSTEKPGTSGETARSLINAPDDLYLQTKAMDVWWMLRDMLGTRPDASLLNYHASEDKDAGYLQRVIEGTPRHDLGWFFEDWVYHDRGLPDFRVESVFSRPIESGGFLVTITVENLGAAGAEVPVTLKMEGGGEIRQRLEVRAKAKASLRMEAAGKPQQVTVNDGSVPESDMSNNTYKIEPVNH